MCEGEPVDGSGKESDVDCGAEEIYDCLLSFSQAHQGRWAQQNRAVPRLLARGNQIPHPAEY